MVQEAHYPLSKPKGPKGKDATIKLPVIGCAARRHTSSC